MTNSLCYFFIHLYTYIQSNKKNKDIVFKQKKVIVEKYKKISRTLELYIINFMMTINVFNIHWQIILALNNAYNS